jgi:hypothetical protein
LAAFGALKNILINKDTDLIVKGGVYVARFVWAFYFTAAKFGDYGKICSIAFVTSTTDALETCDALPLLTQFAAVFHLPASLNAFQLSP